MPPGPTLPCSPPRHPHPLLWLISVIAALLHHQSPWDLPVPAGPQSWLKPAPPPSRLLCGSAQEDGEKPPRRLVSLRIHARKPQVGPWPPRSVHRRPSLHTAPLRGHGTPPTPTLLSDRYSQSLQELEGLKEDLKLPLPPARAPLPPRPLSPQRCWAPSPTTPRAQRASLIACLVTHSPSPLVPATHGLTCRFPSHLKD